MPMQVGSMVTLLMHSVAPPTRWVARWFVTVAMEFSKIEIGIMIRFVPGITLKLAPCSDCMDRCRQSKKKQWNVGANSAYFRGIEVTSWVHLNFCTGATPHRKMMLNLTQDESTSLHLSLLNRTSLAFPSHRQPKNTQEDHSNHRSWET